MFKDYVKVFRAVGEPTRMHMLRLLATRELYVCEIEAVLGISQPRVSLHLRTLREAGLVLEEKEGRKTRISLNRERLFDALNDFAEFLACDLSSLPEFARDLEKLERLDGEPVPCPCCELSIEE